MSKLARKYIYRQVPDPVSGYILNPERGFFSVIIPEERTNLILNPSAELSTTGYAGYGSASIAQTSDYARRGVYSIKVTPTGAQTDGVKLTNARSSYTGSIFAISVDVLAVSGIPMIVTAYFGISTPQTIAEFTGKGRWQRISGLLHGTPSSGTLYIIVRKNGNHSTQPFYVDGFQVETGSYPTTYIDGDQAGYKPGLLDYYWLGAAHGSGSVRTHNCRSGGRVMPLKDYGYDVMSIVGLGMAGLANDIMPYGSLDGGEYHDSHAPSRQFTLTGTLFGKLQGDIQKKRSSLIGALKPDLVDPKQLSVLRYEFGDQCEQDGLTLEIPCVITEGLGGNFDNFHQERLALTFTAPYPYLLEDGYDSAILDDLDNVSVNCGAFRDTAGDWHNIGTIQLSGSGIGTSLKDIYFAQTRGEVFYAGQWDEFEGVSCDRLASYNIDTGNTTYYTGIDDSVMVVYEAPSGDLYIGGAFLSISLASIPHIARLDMAGVWHDVGSGVDDTVMDIAIAANGDIYVCGLFTTLGGAVSANYIGMYDVSAATWVNITPGGDPDAIVNTIEFGPDRKLYIGGPFTTVNGVSASNVAVYDPATGVWAALGNGVSGGSFTGGVFSLCFGADGRLYAAGDFTAPAYFAVYNGGNWEPLGSGIKQTVIGTTVINRIVLGYDGKIYLAGDFAIQGPFNIFNCEYATWDGSTFRYLDGQPPGQADLQACDGIDICPLPSGHIFVSFDFQTSTGGPFYCGAMTTVTNEGSATVHPSLTCHITGGQYDYLLIRNMDTGDEMRFELVMDDGGRFLITNNPGNLKTWSNSRVVENTLFDGSNLATFKLQPGDNHISVFSNRTGASTAYTALYWRNNYWSSDDGTP